MKEELTTQLVPLLAEIREWLTSAVEFGQEQMPLVLREILWWHGIKSAMLFCFFALIVVAMGCYGKSFWTRLVKLSKEEGEPYILFCIPYAAVFVIFCFVMLDCTTWLQILIAPRLFLLEYLKTFIS